MLFSNKNKNRIKQKFDQRIGLIYRAAVALADELWFVVDVDTIIIKYKC